MGDRSPDRGSREARERPELRVVGAIIDSEGALPGEVRLGRSGRVLERGSRGTLGPLLPSERKVHGIALPWSVDGHTHLGDSVWTQEPPKIPFHQVVAPPHGLKHRVLAASSPSEKVEAMHRSLQTMASLGTSATLDFREEGLGGVRLLRRASKGTLVEPIIFGRPADPLSRKELRTLLAEADGLGLSAIRDLPLGAAELARQEVKRAGKRLALHASESVWEPIDPVLDLKPFLLVHLCHATGDDLDAVREAKVPVAVCPRSNALYERFPPIAQLERRGIPILLGTDNVMFQSPDLFREMEFAYLSARARGEPVEPRTLVEAAFVTPWKVLGRPRSARLEVGSPGRALVLRLPPEDPYYQVAARSAHRHLLVPGSSASEA
ncbi:MAG: amidohydrolase family protein [Euryarchaeota archaeon]|nr:amidohydrolase family protein [Euryarchaeota archaeon]MDE1837584.1 amidohydrolase family protein [Euryarchaeota archaeon]MDE1881323.1 amidohydrolase family protein [Euryarchaeota archaeon]MDE2045895.1 amidohydrolase family protein [Thermoplasmata archaeon]